jgi:hypothetical protein
MNPSIDLLITILNVLNLEMELKDKIIWYNNFNLGGLWK